MIHLEKNRRLLWAPSQLCGEPPVQSFWQGRLRKLLLALLASILIVCHPCHGEDIDDELLDQVRIWASQSR